MTYASVYESRALTHEQWAEQRDALLADGWEYLTTSAASKDGPVYVRKLLNGEKNPAPGWISAS